MSALIGIGFIFWLTSIQAFAIGHFCVYCMSSHAAGVIAFIGVLRFSPVWNAVKKPALSIGLPSGGLLAAMIASHVLFLPDLTVVEAAQNLQLDEPSGYSSSSIQFGKKKDSREVTILDGNVTFELSDVPYIGSLDSEIIIAELFDYACEACRKVNKKMHEYQDEHGSIAVVSFPVPLNPACNEHVNITHPGFQQSCEYIRYSLAVWIADQTKYQQFHEYLMDGRRPPKIEEAHSKAVSLVGSEAFENALEDEDVEKRIRDGIALYKFIGAKSLPRIIAGDRVISSTGLSRKKLFSSLNEALNINVE